MSVERPEITPERLAELKAKLKAFEDNFIRSMHEQAKEAIDAYFKEQDERRARR